MSKRFYGTMMHRAGQDPARVAQCRVTNVNLVNWTVDVVSQFDRHYYRDIQVSSAYLHYYSGEGFYVMPDVGAVCMVTIPSDSTPPFVSGFLAPMEVSGNRKLQDPDEAIVTTLFGEEANEEAVDGADAPEGTRSRGGQVPFPRVDSSFHAGRPPIKPGDIWARGRDGNFVVLHRGGVLQLGASELAQRIYIPLGNKVLDISGNYEHMNTGGAIQWGIQQGPSVDNPAVQHMETFRVFANDQFCDVRIAKGHVHFPVGEPDGDVGGRDDLETLQIGRDGKEQLLYEVTLAKGGFTAGSGDLATRTVRNQTKLRFFFDEKGSVFLRGEGAALFQFKRDVKVKAHAITLDIEDNVYLTAKKGLSLDGGTMAELRGDVVRVGAGTNPVARMGDQVLVPLPPAQIVGTVNGSPFTGTIAITTPLAGMISSGNPNVFA